MGKINNVKIDGYRNLREITLNFVQPITTLLAPNNYGKTNVLDAINDAACLVGMGANDQASFISRNGYMSYNKNAPNHFRFEIEFAHNDERDGQFKTVNYGFQISPKTKNREADVIWEELTVNKASIFNRAHNDVQIDTNPGYTMRSTSLLVTNVFLPREGDPLGNPDLVYYTECVRNVFSDMKGLICNKSSESWRDAIDILSSGEIEPDEDIILFYENEKAQFKKFKDTFLDLFCPYIKDFSLAERNGRYSLQFDSVGKKEREKFDSLSQGTKDIFLLLLMVFIRRRSSLLAIEELENGIHPSIHRNVLIKLDDISDEFDTKILLTTHSPSVVRHFDDAFYSSLYIGVPSEDGYARFATLKDTEDVRKDIEKERARRSVSIGEVVFDLLSGEPEDIDDLKGWLEDA